MAQESLVYSVKLIYGKEINYDADGKLKNSNRVVHFSEQEYRNFIPHHQALGLFSAECIDIKGVPAKQLQARIATCNEELKDVGVKKFAKAPEIVTETVQVYLGGEVKDMSMKQLLDFAKENNMLANRDFPITGVIKEVAKYVILKAIENEKVEVKMVKKPPFEIPDNPELNGI